MACLALWLACCLAAQGQDNPRLFELEPYDLLTLKEGNLVLKLQPIEMKRRSPIRDMQPDQTLKVRLFDRPLQTYEVSWVDVAEVKLFEELLLAEASRLVEAERFDEAFEYFQTLELNHAQFPGVNSAVEEGLFREAAKWHKLGRDEQALGLLNELHDRNPGYAKLRSALGTVVDALIVPKFETSHFASARRLLADWSAKFADDPRVLEWQDRFRVRADEELEQAQAHEAAARWREAREHALASLICTPGLEAAKEILRRVHAAHPMLFVGVTELPTTERLSAVSSWAWFRAGRLVSRRLFDPVAGGQATQTYRCSLGTLTVGDDQQSWTLVLAEALTSKPQAGAPTAFDVARCMLARATRNDASYHPAWEALLGSVRATDSQHLTAALRHKYQLQPALLSVPLYPSQIGGAGSISGGLDAPYDLVTREPALDTYRLREGYFARQPTQFQEIMERLYPSVDEALRALRNGDVALVDRIRPSDVARLADVPALQVAAYATPTVHFLLPNPRRPWTAHPTFRRALLYALDRKTILHELLAGADAESGRLLSAPFPAGPAADPDIEPRGFDPSLASALVQGVSSEIQTATAVQPPAPGVRLLLAHPADEVSRRACRAIQRQLTENIANLSLELRELPTTSLATTDDDYDLVYIAWPGMEPLVDVFHLLAPRVTGPGTNATMALALERLANAQDWNAARRQLFELHRQIHDETLLLPLWQIVEYRAWQRALIGVVEYAATPYQDLEAWQGPAWFDPR